jgi:3-hydroxyacyl-CoA dehydrogenase / 3-hydroxy-2-methylbutyryl-CoA dehydrogenase
MVASSVALDGQRGPVSYSASKETVAIMTLLMARDPSIYGIRCVTIAPSHFESPMAVNMAPKVRSSLEKAAEFLRRPGKPREFAQLVRQVIENVMFKEEVIRLDGGMRMLSKI